MVTGAIKNKVDKIWTDIWAGGITNPLTVIEQLTYLMFIRSLDEKELATEDFENMAGEKMEHIFPASEAGQSMRWSRFKDKDSRTHCMACICYCPKEAIEYGKKSKGKPRYHFEALEKKQDV